MAIGDERELARWIAGQADQVGRAPGRSLWRVVLLRLSRGRYGRLMGYQEVPILGTPWQDTGSGDRPNWRMRAPVIGDDFAFQVNYQVCRRCRLGWLDWPYTEPRYERCGLASAGLASLRADHRGVSWHTLGGHARDARPFWAAVGAGVAGGYEQRELCLRALQE
ncbi:hypothetical protein [Streptacidiphilus sp. EB103A]|uniref:hypothetical protein n=1 Tax=Streptacidiphilus sp. EB103A TaxID=3156275 RepID=UPI0035194CC4